MGTFSKWVWHGLVTEFRALGGHRSYSKRVSFDYDPSVTDILGVECIISVAPKEGGAFIKLDMNGFNVFQKDWGVTNDPVNIRVNVSDYFERGANNFTLQVNGAGWMIFPQRIETSIQFNVEWLGVEPEVEPEPEEEDGEGISLIIIGIAVALISGFILFSVIGKKGKV